MQIIRYLIVERPILSMDFTGAVDIYVRRLLCLNSHPDRPQLDGPRPALFLLCLVLLYPTTVGCQATRIPLDTLTVLDDPFVSTEILESVPPKKVLLPDTSGKHPWFIKEFYSWTEKKDPDFVIMVIKDHLGELLYIDKNLDNDLTNDGPPLWFPSTQDSITYELVSPSDSRKRVQLLLSRRPTNQRLMAKSPGMLHEDIVTFSGDMNPQLRSLTATLKGEPEFKGTRGTFYLTDRVTLRRGIFTVDRKRHAVGLFDKDNNGLFNDADDVFIVDNDGDSQLTFSTRGQVFSLNDVIPIGGKNFTISALDKYGTWVDLVETEEPSRTLFIHKDDSTRAAGARTESVKDEVWNVMGRTLEGDSVRLREYRGRNLLLNFWGEWCRPCLAEIPALLRARRMFPPTTLQIVSFVQTTNPMKARKVVADSAMKWPQVRLDEATEKLFGIRGYPTNILILPDGHEGVITSSISDVFIKKYIR